MRTMLGSLTTILLLSACGIPDDKPLKDITAEELQQLCADVEDAEEDCGGGVTITRTKADCEEMPDLPDDCAATVGDLRDCNEAPLCDLADNDGCRAVIVCVAPQ